MRREIDDSLVTPGTFAKSKYDKQDRKLENKIISKSRIA